MVTVNNITRADVNDFTTILTMRYRLESDPDVDASYTTVTDTQTLLGITYPVFDPASLPDGVYILHSYQTSDGTGTGTKVRFVVAADLLV